MSEIINWQEEDRKHTALATVILMIITDAPKGISDAIIREAKEPLKVQMEINGREVRFSTVIDLLLQQYDRKVKEAAVEMRLAERDAITEAVRDVFDKFADGSLLREE